MSARSGADPKPPLAFYILGTLGLGHDAEKALRYFARAVGEEPQNPYYHLSLGEAYLKVSEFTPAIRHIQYALDLKPDLVEALCTLGDAYTKSTLPATKAPKAVQRSRQEGLSPEYSDG